MRAVNFTKRNTTSAIIKNVINSPKKAPIPNGPNVNSCQFTPAGVKNSTIGIIKLSTNDCTNEPRYIPIMKATANPITLYLFKNCLNSSKIFFGGGGGGGFKISFISLISSIISSSFEIV